MFHQELDFIRNKENLIFKENGKRSLMKYLKLMANNCNILFTNYIRHSNRRLKFFFSFHFKCKNKFHSYHVREKFTARLRINHFIYSKHDKTLSIVVKLVEKGRTCGIIAVL